MFWLRMCTAAAVASLCWPALAGQYMSVEEAREHPDFIYQGEYLGKVSFDADGEPETVGLQVAARDNGQFDALLYHGGLPGKGWYEGHADRAALSGQRSDAVLELETYQGLTFTHQRPGFVARDEQGQVRGTLSRIERTSPTMGKPPLDDARVLFDGTNLDHWDSNTDRVGDLLAQGATTAQDHGDMYLHMEFKTSFIPGSTSQSRSNSGVYIQNRYEVQILDSFAEPPTLQGNGSLYNEHAPLVNMSYPPLQWQTYDIYFQAPRFDDHGNKTENTRITVYHNGVLVQDDVELSQGTGAGGRREEVPEAELYLQSHTGPVRFRNIWMTDDPTPEPRTWTPDDAPVQSVRHELTPGQAASFDAAAAATERLGPVGPDANHSGYTGMGFANFAQDDGEAKLRWTLHAEQAGAYELRTYYALDSGNRPLRLRVNEQTVNDALDFPATGGWSSWDRVTADVQLDQGENVIELAQIDIRGANIDRVELHPAD